MHVNKNEFDSLYLQNCDYYIDYIKKALEQIAASDYNEVSGTGNVLCHHDLAHHNIMIGNDNNVYFLDFDYSVIDLPEHDLSNLLTKAAKKSNWNIKAVDNIMDGYDKTEQTGKSFKNIVLAYLMFPVDFYDISKAYYMRTKIWDESDFIEKLNRKAGYKNQREEFIEYFKTLCVK